MAQTLKQQVENIIGAVGNDNAISQWCEDGCRFVANFMSNGALEQWAQTADEVAGTGVSVIGKRVLGAYLDNVGCAFRDNADYARFTDAVSLHFARTDSPVYTIRDGKVFIWPLSGTARKVKVFEFPAPVFGDTTVNQFPPSYVPIVIQYACIQGKHAQIAAVRTALTTLPAAALFAFVPPAVTTIATNAAFTIDLTADFTNLITDIRTDEDLEKAAGQADMIRTKLQEFERESGIEFQRVQYNAQKQNDADTLKAIKDLEASIMQYTANLNRYLNDVQAGISKMQAMLAEVATLKAVLDVQLAAAFGVGQKGS